jgi:zinc/manganese transport system substrate-binding protein
MRRRYVPVLFTVTAALAAGGCGGDVGGSSVGAGGNGPPIVATTSIWADVARNVACDDAAEVVTVIPAGSDPHGFEASIDDRATMANAALVIANGAALEASLLDTIEAVEGEGVPVFEAASAVELLEGGDDAHRNDEEVHSEGEAHSEVDAKSGEDDHGHGAGGDPHLWHDPSRVNDVVDSLAVAMVDAEVIDRATVDACVKRYKAVLADAETAAATLLERVPKERRKLVTNHDALRYFAEHYGYKVIGAVIPSPSTLGEASIGELEDLAATIEAEQIPAIFAESQHSDADARALADRIGSDVAVATLFTDSVGEEGSGAETLAGMWTSNARIIANALTAT